MKSPHEMTLEELRAVCDANEAAFYKDRAASEPNNPRAQEEYQQHCLLKGLDPTTGKQSRFVNMSKDEIAAEWEQAGKDGDGDAGPPVGRRLLY